VLLAILLACINTMLMAGREQTNDIGILKALGFTDARVFRLMLVQSLALCGIGGGMGIALALFMDTGMSTAMASMFPAYGISSDTLIMAVVATLMIGLIAGIVPAWRASRMRIVQAFGDVL
jgi:putative ABC transport system permease protein